MTVPQQRSTCLDAAHLKGQGSSPLVRRVKDSSIAGKTACVMGFDACTLGGAFARALLNVAPLKPAGRCLEVSATGWCSCYSSSSYLQGSRAFLDCQ